MALVEATADETIAKDLPVVPGAQGFQAHHGRQAHQESHVLQDDQGIHVLQVGPSAPEMSAQDTQDMAEAQVMLLHALVRKFRDAPALVW